jgi:hypothetical protein
MEPVKFSLAVAAVVGAALAVPALAAPPANVTPVATPPAATAQAARPPVPLARGGGVHRVDPAASAASASRNDPDVRTTAEDGRTVTRNAQERKSTTAASGPND